MARLARSATFMLLVRGLSNAFWSRRDTTEHFIPTYNPGIQAAAGRGGGGGGGGKIDSSEATSIPIATIGLVPPKVDTQRCLLAARIQRMGLTALMYICEVVGLANDGPTNLAEAMSVEKSAPIRRPDIYAICRSNSYAGADTQT
jgi:hypothetical protein